VIGSDGRLRRAGAGVADDRAMPQRRGLGGLEVDRCKTWVSLSLDAICWPRDSPIWKLGAALKCRSCRKGRYAAPFHDQADRNAGSHTLQMPLDEEVGCASRTRVRARSKITVAAQSAQNSRTFA
jgi:hypothetical protein